MSDWRYEKYRKLIFDFTFSILIMKTKIRMSLISKDPA
jgi:hypothetical protein